MEVMEVMGVMVVMEVMEVMGFMDLPGANFYRYFTLSPSLLHHFCYHSHFSTSRRPVAYS